MKRATRAMSIAVLLCAVVAFAAGCPQHGPLVLAKDAALTNQAFERAIVIAHDKEGIIDDATTRDLLGYSKKIAQYDDAAVTAIQNANKTNALAAIDQAIQTLDDAVTSGLAGVKNPTKQTELHSILLALRGTLTTAKALLS